MSNQLLNEAERFLIERWDEASRLKEAMESLRKKCKELLLRVIEKTKKNHPEFDFHKLYHSEGQIMFGRSTWPHDNDNPSGMALFNVQLDYFAKEGSEDPYATVQAVLPRRDRAKFDFREARTDVQEEAKSLYGSNLPQFNESKWYDHVLIGLPAPSKKELLSAFASEDGEEFVALLVKQFDQMARFIPVLDKVFSKFYGEEFHRLASEWHKHTDHLSSMEKASKHSAYQEIIGLGRGVIPFLLRDLADNHTHWFIALETMTKARPTSAAIAGNIPKMTEAWLSWAKENGYQW